MDIHAVITFYDFKYHVHQHEYLTSIYDDPPFFISIVHVTKWIYVNKDINPSVQQMFIYTLIDMHEIQVSLTLLYNI